MSERRTGLGRRQTEGSWVGGAGMGGGAMRGGAMVGRGWYFARVAGGSRRIWGGGSAGGFPVMGSGLASKFRLKDKFTRRRRMVLLELELCKR